MKCGDVYGRLTVIETKPKGRVEVECECGTRKEVYARNLKSGATRSCGCLHAERSAANMRRVRLAACGGKQGGRA